MTWLGNPVHNSTERLLRAFLWGKMRPFLISVRRKCDTNILISTLEEKGCKKTCGAPFLSNENFLLMWYNAQRKTFFSLWEQDIKTNNVFEKALSWILGFEEITLIKIWKLFQKMSKQSNK